MYACVFLHPHSTQFNMAAQTFQQEYMQMPPITRAYTTACVLTTIAVVQFNLIFGFILFCNSTHFVIRPCQLCLQPCHLLQQSSSRRHISSVTRLTFELFRHFSLLSRENILFYCVNKCRISVSVIAYLILEPRCRREREGERERESEQSLYTTC